MPENDVGERCRRAENFRTRRTQDGSGWKPTGVRTESGIGRNRMLPVVDDSWNGNLPRPRMPTPEYTGRMVPVTDEERAGLETRGPSEESGCEEGGGGQMIFPEDVG